MEGTELSNSPINAPNLNTLVEQMHNFKDEIKRFPVFRWATVTSLAPLTFQLDGSQVPLLGHVSNAGPSLYLPGERVRVEIQNGRVTAHSAAGRDWNLRGTSSQRVALAAAGGIPDGVKFYDTDQNREYIWRNSAWAWNVLPGTLLGQYTQPSGNVGAGTVFLRLNLSGLPEGLNVKVETSSISLFRQSGGIGRSYLRRNLSATNVTNTSATMDIVRHQNLPTGSQVEGTPPLKGIVTITSNGNLRLGVTSDSSMYGEDNPSIYAFAA